MRDKNQNIKYDGEVLTDITSFSMIQNIFDGQKTVNKSQIETFDSIIQLLVFFEGVWIVEPFIYGGNIEIESQEILNELIRKKIVNQFSQNGSDSYSSFKSQFEEIKEIISPLTLDNYQKCHSNIVSDLQLYEENFSLSKNEDARKLADLVNLDYSLIPLTANLLRSNFYFKLVQQMKNKENKLISYSPNLLRSSLIDDIINHQKSELEVKINKILRDQIKTIEGFELKNIEDINKRFYTDYEMDLPLLTALILDQCKSKDDIFDEILTLRKDSNAIKMRKWLTNVQIALYQPKSRKNFNTYKAQLEDISQNFESTKSNKAKLINTLTKPAVIEASAASAASSNFLPLIVQGIKELGDTSLNYLLRRDYYLLFKMRSKAEDISFSKREFEKIFGCQIVLDSDPN